jgi:hypothetical protein
LSVSEELNAKEAELARRRCGQDRTVTRASAIEYAHTRQFNDSGSAPADAASALAAPSGMPDSAHADKHPPAYNASAVGQLVAKIAQYSAHVVVVTTGFVHWEVAASWACGQ